ncbi:hypothetical protein FE257_007614 [Aspergillus nanangensis]|uniref:Uncharacterized protein n=1 Tax=Aspergillus nanangensis TaxID=2582783 RepID=A0AAD4CMA4_ASPNN|nr:hypothetical protein FE257_007614 [Aspergillus nanangensis]
MKLFSVLGAVAALFLSPVVAHGVHHGVNHRVMILPVPPQPSVGSEPPVGTDPPTFPPMPTGTALPTGTATSVPIPTGTGIAFPPADFERAHARQFGPVAI